MTPKRLAQMAGLALLILAGLNVVTLRMAQKAFPFHSFPRLLAQIGDIDFLFVGDSTVAKGCQTEAFNTGWASQTGKPATAIKLALHGSTSVEHCLLVRQALAGNRRVRYVVCGFWDYKLTEAPSDRWTDQIGNCAMGYSFEPEVAAELYSPGSQLAKWRFQWLGRIPLFAERWALWVKVEILRRKLGGIGMSASRAPSEKEDDYVRRYAIDYRRRGWNAVAARTQFSRAITELIQSAHRHGARVILVNMPMREQHHRLYYSSDAWQQYARHVESLARQQNLLYLDASEWVPDATGFEDSRHLNNRGSTLFSERLGHALGELLIK